MRVGRFATRLLVGVTVGVPVTFVVLACLMAVNAAKATTAVIIAGGAGGIVGLVMQRFVEVDHDD